MRRLLVIALVGALTALAVGLGACGGDDDEGYRVRAIFDNAAFLVAGEDVKVAGVTVGRIDDLAVTPDKKAAVVLEITHPGYQDFRADARCTIRPQSLIGEQFVECSPTQQRAATEPVPPPLRLLEEGDGEGQRLLPVTQTSASVALDLLNNIWRLPVRQRLTLIINELGTGLAGRGGDLDAVLRRSAPALQDLNEVLDILARQNDTLEQLAVDSDRILAPLARERRRVTGFVKAAQEAAAATAERREDLAGTFERLPRFLTELRPTMQRLEGLAGEGAPLAADLRGAAADFNELLVQLGPFSAQAIPTLRSLGEVGDRGIPAIRAARPVVRQLGDLGRVAQPVGATLAGVLRTFERNDGIPNLLRLIYHTTLSINGYDGISHFQRAGLIVNTCTDYAVQFIAACSAKFAASATSAQASAVPAGPRDEVLQRMAAVLDGADPDDVLRASVDEPVPTPAAAPGTAPETPDVARSTGGAVAPAAPAQPDEQGTPRTGADPSAATDDLLGYLFGKDAP